MNKDEIKSCKQFNKKASLVTVRLSTAITTTTTAVKTNIQPQFQSVKSRPFITLPKYIPQKKQFGSEQRKRKQTEKQEHFISYR